MAKRILVPLSTRESAREIVPLIGALARGNGATVRLLQVFPVPKQITSPCGRVVAYAHQEMERLTVVGLDDLRTTAETYFHDVPVESTVRFGGPVEGILLEADTFDADLIALAAPERSRLRRLVSAGIADQVARKASVPTLLLRPDSRGEETERHWRLA